MRRCLLRRVVKPNKTPAFILTQFGFTPENADQKITLDGDTATVTTDKLLARRPSSTTMPRPRVAANIVDIKTVMANEADGDTGNELAGSSNLRRHRRLCAEKLQAERGLYPRGPRGALAGRCQDQECLHAPCA
ncbi:hypothetical protein MASR1M65_03880 [Saprospiraceae bacterium]